MRTVIRGGWVVAYASGSHTLVRDGIVIVEDDRVHAIATAYDGTADLEIDARGKLVSPGFIDTHVHPGIRATHRLIADTGRQVLMGQVFLEHTLTKPGRRTPSDLRYDEAPTSRTVPDDFGALFTQAELLRNGITTFIDYDARVSYQEQEAAVAEKLGLRAYLGPGFQSSILEGTENGHWRRERIDARGR